MADSLPFVPALGKAWLTPLYDPAIAWLTRERLWRQTLLEQIELQPNERVLDVGCGTGSFAVLMKKKVPDSQITGIDPDSSVLSIARKKMAQRGIDVKLIEGFLEAGAFSARTKFDKIVSSLVLHQVPLSEKSRILSTAFDLIEGGGFIHIADFGLQRTWLMRRLFRIVQRLDGYEFTEPNAQGILPKLMAGSGFVGVRETAVIPTLAGSISLYVGKKP